MAAPVVSASRVVVGFGRGSSCEPSGRPLPPSLTTVVDAPAMPTPSPALPAATQAEPQATTVGVAVEVIRTVPASGNLGICGQQFWLGPALAGRKITAWADSTVVHLLLDGVHRKTVPSRLSAAHPHQLLAGDGEPAGLPPIGTGRAGIGAAVELERTINATGLLALAGRQHPVGFHLAGRRVTVRIDHGVLHLLGADRTVLRSMPNPLSLVEVARIRDARPAGPAPAPTTTGLRVERRVSCRGSVVSPGRKSKSVSVTPGAPSPSRKPTPPSASTTVTSCSPRFCAPARVRSSASRLASPEPSNHHNGSHSV